LSAVRPRSSPLAPPGLLPRQRTAMLDGVFGTGKTPAERIKEYNRQIKKSVREIDRERTALERQEKKLLADIKKAAKDGQMDSAKIMAKDLVRTRGYIKKMFKMKAHMEAVSLRLQTMSSSAQMAQCMKGVTKVMGKMNAKMSSANIQKIMMEFEKQNEMMGMKEEMMGDAMDDAFADEEDSEEEDSILGSVLAEIGVELDNKMMGASTAPMQAAASTAAAEPQGVPAVGGGGDDLDAELQKRLDNLRRT